MYIPDIYKNDDDEEILDFIQQNGFGILINQSNGNIAATHIPLELTIDSNENKILDGHISKENPQWHSFENDDRVLIIFSGPHAYISPSWYDHENVPTWNYAAVHVYGKIKIIDDQAAIQSLKKLVDKYESTVENPTTVDDYSKKTMLQVRGIVAFKIEVTTVHAVKKMSQNRDDKNYNNIISELEKTKKSDNILVAKEMKKCPR